MMTRPPDSQPPRDPRSTDAPAEEFRRISGDDAEEQAPSEDIRQAPSEDIRQVTTEAIGRGEWEDAGQEPILAEQIMPPASDHQAAEHESTPATRSLVAGGVAEYARGEEKTGAGIAGASELEGASGTRVGHQAGKSRARWWSPLAVAGISLAVFIFTSGIMAVIALFIVHGKISPEVLRQPEPMQKVSESRLGLFIVVVIPQIALVIPCLVAAYLSPVPFRQRLGLVRGNWPVWTWPAAAAATPLVGMVSGLVVGLFLDESDALKQMTEIFRGHGQNGFLFPLALMIGATPAICEEFLFRGYIQRRLTRSLGPLVGIGIASFLFAAFHLDLVHVIAVFPLGLFLGWVSWQSGSLFPAILGHFVNNFISVVGIVFAPEENPDVLALPAVALTLGIFAMGILGMVVVSIVSIAYRRTEPGELAAGEAQLAS